MQEACGIVIGDFSGKSQDLIEELPLDVAQLKETLLPDSVEDLVDTLAWRFESCGL